MYTRESNDMKAFWIRTRILITSSYRIWCTRTTSSILHVLIDLVASGPTRGRPRCGLIIWSLCQWTLYHDMLTLATVPDIHDNYELARLHLVRWCSAKRPLRIGYPTSTGYDPLGCDHVRKCVPRSSFRLANCNASTLFSSTSDGIL